MIVVALSCMLVRVRFRTARFLATGQTVIPLFYTLGLAVPYLFLFTFKGTSHCPPGIGCQAPSDVIDGPLLFIVVPAILLTYVGPVIATPMLLGSFTSLARRRSQMPPGLRRWLSISALATLSYIVFNLLPPGRILLNWVLD